MLSFFEHPSRHATQWKRRELLHVGGVGSLGIALPHLLRKRAQAGSEASADPTFGRAKNIIYLFMAGGPSQYETFDPKPDAPAEIRGSFQPIATNVPGVRICELLPRIATIADKLAIVRSMATDDPNHESGGYWVNTGYKYLGPNMRDLSPTDWPTLGSIVKMLKPSETVPFSTVQIPEPIVANPNVFLPGQNGGFLGRRWDPEFLKCDPTAARFQIEEFTLPPDLASSRLSARRDLLSQFDGQVRLLERQASIREYDRMTQEAFNVLLSGTARGAFALNAESDAVRNRYGRTKWGQSVLLARRLVEAGVRMVFVNWPREAGDLSAGNPLWDTHSQNNARMKDVLCPQFDLGFTALIEDLDQRGLLDETLVVAIGEMGRTPRFNAGGGRDHWGNVFSFVMAGAGIKTAQVYGASDRTGAFPVADRVQPQDLTATILHLLGIGHEATFPDRTGRPFRATEGEPIAGILGTQPATLARTQPGGVIELASPISDALLTNTDFENPLKLASIETPVRGWQAHPLLEPTQADGFCVWQAHVPGARSRSGSHHVGIGYGLMTGNGTGQITRGSRAILVQEVHNPRPGRYTFSAYCSGGAYDRPDYYRDVWCRNFQCRLVIFGYQDESKDPRKIVEYASETFEPPFADAYSSQYRPYSISVVLNSQNGNANQLSHGIGVGVFVEKVTPGILDVAQDGPRSQGLIRIDDAALEFAAL